MTGDRPEELPESVIDRVETLTRRARAATDPDERAAYRARRTDLLGTHGYTARLRSADEEGTRTTLVLYPAEWVEDGTLVPDRVEEIDRGVEVPLEGPGEAEEWETVAEHNRAIARTVASEHGEAHGANARALAEFMSNHYAQPIESASEQQLAEFRSEYYPRNVWPTDTQQRIVAESVRLTVACAESESGPG